MKVNVPNTRISSSRIKISCVDGDGDGKDNIHIYEMSMMFINIPSTRPLQQQEHQLATCHTDAGKMYRQVEMLDLER